MTRKSFDVAEAAATLRYYGGWADKNHGKVGEIDSVLRGCKLMLGS